MSKVIHAYKIEVTEDIFELNLCIDEGYGFCDIEYQNDHLFLWALVDNEGKDAKPRKFKFVKTAEVLQDKYRWYFIKTIHTPMGSVRHLFMVEENLPRKAHVAIDGKTLVGAI